MKFASRSAIESESSAKAGSKFAKAKDDELYALPWPWLSRSDVRELGRRGVVGLEEGRGRKVDRFEVEPSIAVRGLLEGNGRESELVSRGMFTVMHAWVRLRWVSRSRSLRRGRKPTVMTA